MNNSSFSGDQLKYTFSSDSSFSASSKSILDALIRSKEDNTCVGIKAMAFGRDHFVTAVEDIILEEGKVLVKLKYYDSSGYMLPSYKINLLEIQSVVSFSTPFENPFLKSLGKAMSVLPTTEPPQGENISPGGQKA